MYVCNCHAVPASTVRSLIEAGAHSVDDVGRACGAGGDCGACRGEIADMIEHHGEARAARPCERAHAGHAGCADCPRAHGDSSTSRAA